MPNNANGYIALMSALIVSVVVFGILFVSAAGAFYARAEALDFESRQRSFFLAWSCLQMARLRIVQNPDAPEIGTVSVGSDSCDIKVIALDSPDKGQISIQSRAVINSAAADLQMVVDSGDLSLIFWRDLDSS